MPQLLKAFIARSFLPEDEKKLEPILSFLDTFKSIGFICHSAEPAEVESVSAKVRQLIDDSDVFIGIFTRRYPVYDLRAGIRGAWQVASGIAPRLWSAPAWVLQESGYALRKMGIKRLILLRETGVEQFGLQGDLEYLPFAPERPSDIFPKLNEMIHGLVAEVSGTQVEVIITQRQEETRIAPEPNLPQPKAEAPKDVTEEPDIIAYYIEMSNAMRSRNFRALGDARSAGTALIEAGKEKSLDQLAWDCYYHESCFTAGDADALESLRRMRAANPNRWEPVASMAHCLNGSKEYEESAELYLKAAELSKEDSKAWYLVRAAVAFRELKQHSASKKAAYAALATATGDVKSEALTVLYESLRNGGETYLAFATAESALHENPQLGLRFKLGLDYHGREMYELGLYHFKFLYERNNSDSSSLHNLALIHSDSKLPISAVRGYKAAFAMGETLSAANLGYMYLDCGMSDEANTVVQNAIKIDGHEAGAEKCLSEIIQRSEDEKSRETALLATASASRDFLIRMGRALREEPPSLSGTWRFPFGEMTLAWAAGEITGTADIRTEQSGFGLSLFQQSGDPPIVKTHRHSLEGKLSGCVCSFKLNVSEIGARNPLVMNAFASLLASGGVTRSGFIVFATNGNSATYVEMAEQKLGKTETTSRLR